MCQYPLRPPSTTFSQIILYLVPRKKLKNVSCEYNRLNGWNSTLQAAWYIRRVRIICFLWTKPTIWLILSFTQNIVRACSMFYPYEGYRSVTPLDAARVNRTIFHNHSVHWPTKLFANCSSCEFIGPMDGNITWSKLSVANQAEERPLTSREGFEECHFSTTK